MRRDYFELAVEQIGWVDSDGDPRKPHVYIDFHGPDGLLRERLTGTEDGLLDGEEIDVAFRLQTSHEEDPDAAGVVGVTNRITGDFVLELNQAAADVLQFIRAAREYGQQNDGDGGYRVEITVEGEPLVSYEKETFLVYDPEGNLLRRESLIPSGVEL
ncbi:DUF5793 family protein [Halorarum halobium]|uniref:DUF5793 family protein n=1 Tax=Halorarum halobium TaxID=3075121 RepID=UPI0028A7061B|nr:DUF5793 family protein [Halobaculum sp. XH14]